MVGKGFLLGVTHPRGWHQLNSLLFFPKKNVIGGGRKSGCSLDPPMGFCFNLLFQNTNIMQNYPGRLEIHKNVIFECLKICLTLGLTIMLIFVKDLYPMQRYDSA